MPDVEIKVRSKDEDDFLVIGCDGIWETMTAEDICKIGKEKMNNNMSIEKVVEDLLDQLIAKETQDGLGCDNMSCIIVRFKDLTN